jgi:hypothetical protein
MAGDIGWNTVELQIEALVPGILILGEVLALATPSTSSVPIPESEFVRGALFVAGAYSIGLVSSYVSRMILDSISERGPRMVVFGCFAHGDLDRAVNDCRDNDSKFLEDFEREKDRRSVTVAQWNAVYRSALRRTKRRKEVDRRRAQGRVLRNLLLPAIGAPFIFLQFPWSAIIALVSFFFIACLYSYAEYVNFAEAYDISGAKPKCPAIITA